MGNPRLTESKLDFLYHDKTGESTIPYNKHNSVLCRVCFLNLLTVTCFMQPKDCFFRLLSLSNYLVSFSVLCSPENLTPCNVVTVFTVKYKHSPPLPNTPLLRMCSFFPSFFFSLPHVSQTHTLTDLLLLSMCACVCLCGWF